MWNPFKSKEKAQQDDTDKLKAENEQVLAGLSTLAQRVQMPGDPTADDALEMQKYLERLRREGSGL